MALIPIPRPAPVGLGPAKIDGKRRGVPIPADDIFVFNRALVLSNISGATVHVDGEPRCDTPCEIAVPVGDGTTHEIRVRKDGYVDAVQNWRPKTVDEPLPVMADLKEL